MDGTLVDNLAYHFMAFDAYAKREGFTLVEPVTLKINGMHSNDIFPMILGEEVVVEYGFAITNDYGQSGEAGGDIGENDYGGF